jgi:hypothetical protein
MPLQAKRRPGTNAAKSGNGAGLVPVGYLRLCFCPPRRPRSPRRQDRLPQRAPELGARRQRLARALASVAERTPGEGQLIAGSVDEASAHAQIEELAQLVDPMSPANLEFGFPAWPRGGCARRPSRRCAALTRARWWFDETV